MGSKLASVWKALREVPRGVFAEFLRNGAFALTASLALVACGGGSDPVDPNQPLGGRELGKASQLEGTWLGVTDGDYVGFEFMASGKVLATPITAALTGVNTGVMYDYSVLDGGRLSLVAPDGRSQVFGVTIAGDQLELNGFMMLSDANSQRFRRLPKGQTLEQGIEEQEKLDAAAYMERHNALTAFLGRPDLVMAPAVPSPGAPPAIALELIGVGGTGRAWHDDQPPHLDEITTRIETADNDSRMPAVHVTFGPQIQPAPQQQRGGGTIFFRTSGDGDEPQIVAQVTYGNQSFELAIRRDPARHREIVGRFDAEIARIDALRAPLLSALQDYAVLEGASSAQVQNQATNDRFVLVRDAASGNYSGEGALAAAAGNRPAQTGPVTAVVAVLDDRAMLLINGFSRQYQLTLAEPGAGKLTGGWFPTGGQSGWQSELTITDAVDAATRERRNDAQRKALLALDPSTPFVGFADVLDATWGIPGPITLLTVTPRPDGTFDAEANYPQLDGTAKLTGQIAVTLTGVALQLRATEFAAASNFGYRDMAGRRFGSQVWALQVADPAARDVKLVGSGQGMGAVELVPMTDAWKRDNMQRITSALAAGANFHATKLTQSTSPDTIVRFTLDAASRKITGAVTAGGEAIQIYPTQPLAGELGEQNGWPMVRLVVGWPRQPDRKPDYAMTLFAVPKGEGLALMGTVTQISVDRRDREVELIQVL